VPKLPVASVLIRVARDVGPSFLEVARQPYALTLYLFCVLIDHDRIQAAIDTNRRLDSASLMAVAFHEPKNLKKIERSLSGKPSLPSAEDRKAAMERTRALLEKKKSQQLAQGNIEVRDGKI
jgi:hypothetical protein